jgi:hypothetical protein
MSRQQAERTNRDAGLGRPDGSRAGCVQRHADGECRGGRGQPQGDPGVPAGVWPTWRHRGEDFPAIDKEVGGRG